jgi:peptidoglycan/xylan/chitin deacetylase (PgdA/CDA1 family)
VCFAAHAVQPGGAKSLSLEPIDGQLLPPNTISLTFDDGPDAYTRQIADLLYRAGIKATFFINGCRFKGTPDASDEKSTCHGQSVKYAKGILPYLVSRGHRIANHTQDHMWLKGQSLENIAYQIGTTQAILDPFVRDDLYLFRAPYGAWDGATSDTARQAHELDKLIGTFGWDVGGPPSVNPGGDWGCVLRNVSPEECADGYKAAIDERPDHNGLILIHDRNEFAPGTDYTLRLVQRLLTLLPRPQYVFVPLDALPGNVFPNPSLIWTSTFPDSAGWGTDASRYGTVRLANVDGDALGRADVCGRHPALGIRCARSTGNGFGAVKTWLATEYTDALGWRPEEYSTTIQFADLNGDGRADVCGRGMWGMRCALSKKENLFGPASWWSQGTDFSDLEGWGVGARFYGTIRLGDVNGDRKADVCGRASWGIVCALSDGARFGPAVTWSPDFADLAWAPDEYAMTIDLGDVNGDGRADVCGRSSTGILCAIATADEEFAPATHWTPFRGVFSDQDGWASPPKGGTGTAASKYRSIHLADVNADGRADICGRNATGVVCALSNGAAFVDYRYVVHDDFTDALGWASDSNGTTVQYADVDGDGAADVCGRGYNGMLCARALIP